jgi:chemosensory pili system protein ChpA (sensor histidine kinase/response regulator)
VLLKQVENAQFEDGSVGIIVEGIKKPYIITVDEIIGRETAVTKKLGRIVEGLKHITGATISPSGEVRLIIDPIRLIEEKTEGTLNYSKTTTDQPKSTGKTYIPNSVLIVDDSISIRKFLSSIISDMNLAVDEAYDGANALEKLEKRRYDLIITDLEMPVLNGYELIDKIRNYYRDNSTSIFVLTSRATEKHKNKAFELGANDFLIKPLNEDKIKEKIREVIFERA